MYIRSLRLQGFRCFQDAEFDFAPDVTTLVGENGVGKSSIGRALRCVFSQAVNESGDVVGTSDFPFFAESPLLLQVRLQLEPKEVREFFVKPLLPQGAGVLEPEDFEEWVVSQGCDAVITLKRPGQAQVTTTWGQVHFRGDYFCIGDPNFGAREDYDWYQVLGGPSFLNQLSSLRGLDIAMAKSR